MPLMNSRDRYLAKAARVYHNQLVDALKEKDASHVASYLYEHGLPTHTTGGRKVIEDYQLGWVDDPLKGDERFTDMLSMPYLTRNGPKGIRFRNMGEGHPKIAQHTGQHTRLYNTAAYFQAEDTIGISEGEIDAIVATERLGIPTLGIPGCEVWLKNRATWSTIFKNFSTVYVWIDGDTINERTGLRPGEEMGRVIQEDLGFRAKLITCPEHEDVSSMVAAGRADELKSKLEDKEDDEDDE